MYLVAGISQEAQWFFYFTYSKQKREGLKLANPILDELASPIIIMTHIDTGISRRQQTFSRASPFLNILVCVDNNTQKHLGAKPYQMSMIQQKAQQPIPSSLPLSLTPSLVRSLPPLFAPSLPLSPPPSFSPSLPPSPPLSFPPSYTVVSGTPSFILLAAESSFREQFQSSSCS